MGKRNAWLNVSSGMGVADREFLFVVETEIAFHYWISSGQSKLKMTNIHQSTSVKKSNTVNLSYELILLE